jgi:predicted glutamine amidotransferase
MAGRADDADNQRLPMCRLAAYLGEPLFLEELIAKPRHSLMRQSLRAEEAKMQTNGDGCGIGWYGERDEPGVYREALPAWSDDNLLALSQTLRSRLFFAHVRAATAGANSRQNCHPFSHGRFLFMHNGQVGGYATLRRTMESWLPDALYAERRGATDSELLFLLAMARVRDGQSVVPAVLAVLDDTVTLMRSRGVEQPLRFAATLSDGQQLWAFRLASDDKPPTLYLQACGSGSIVASEPLCDAAKDAHAWTALAPGSVLMLGADGAQQLVHAELRAAAAAAA